MEFMLLGPFHSISKNRVVLNPVDMGMNTLTNHFGSKPGL